MISSDRFGQMQQLARFVFKGDDFQSEVTACQVPAFLPVYSFALRASAAPGRLLRFAEWLGIVVPSGTKARIAGGLYRRPEGLLYPGILEKIPWYCMVTTGILGVPLSPSRCSASDRNDRGMEDRRHRATSPGTEALYRWLDCRDSRDSRKLKISWSRQEIVLCRRCAQVRVVFENLKKLLATSL